MRTNREHVTMDGNEAKLLGRYEARYRGRKVEVVRMATESEDSARRSQDPAMTELPILSVLPCRHGL
jgi:hypothetical protein